MHNILLTGPMFAQKSTRLISRLEKYTLANMHVAWFEPKRDTRGGTHNSFTTQKMAELKNSEFVHCFQIEQPKEIFSKIADQGFLKLHCIFIDEFFMIPFTRQFFYDYNKSFLKEVPLVFAGLISGWYSKLFPAAIEILPFMDEIDKENAICMHCGKPANYSYFNGDWNNEEIVIDDNQGAYSCLCHDCYMKKTKKPIEAEPRLN